MTEPSDEMSLVPVGTGRYVSRITELRNTQRVDIEVIDADPHDAPFSDIMPPLRKFFDRLDAEAQQYRGDPVALTQALARLEALLADVRHVHATVRALDAEALSEARIRRLTVSDVATVEGVGSIDRTNWQHRELLAMMLMSTKTGIVDMETGEMLYAHQAADRLLDWFTPNWKLTPIREAGLDPHDYCDVATDDNGRAVSTPSVKIVDNTIRKMRA